MWFGIFIVICVAVMVDDARKDTEFMKKFNDYVKNLEE